MVTRVPAWPPPVWLPGPSVSAPSPYAGSGEAVAGETSRLEQERQERKERARERAEEQVDLSRIGSAAVGGPGQQGEIAATVAAEAEVVPDHQVADAQPVHQELVDEDLRPGVGDGQRDSLALFGDTEHDKLAGQRLARHFRGVKLEPLDIRSQNILLQYLGQNSS